MKLKLTQEQIDTLSYDDVAYLVIKEYNRKMKIQELFKYVIKVMKLNEEDVIEEIADFFELLITDKRFLMLENGYWDLKENHNKKISLDEDEDDEDDLEIELEDEDEDLEDDEEMNYDEDSSPDDDVDDGLENLIIIDEDEEDL